jgi:hypothetical protein
MWWWQQSSDRHGNMRVGSILTEDRRGLEPWENLWWATLNRLATEQACLNCSFKLDRTLMDKHQYIVLKNIF